MLMVFPTASHPCISSSQQLKAGKYYKGGGVEKESNKLHYSFNQKYAKHSIPSSLLLEGEA